MRESWIFTNDCLNLSGWSRYAQNLIVWHMFIHFFVGLFCFCSTKKLGPQKKKHGDPMGAKKTGPPMIERQHSSGRQHGDLEPGMDFDGWNHEGPKQEYKIQIYIYMYCSRLSPFQVIWFEWRFRLGSNTNSEQTPSWWLLMRRGTTQFVSIYILRIHNLLSHCKKNWGVKTGGNFQNLEPKRFLFRSEDPLIKLISDIAMLLSCWDIAVQLRRGRPILDLYIYS